MSLLLHWHSQHRSVMSLEQYVGGAGATGYERLWRLRTYVQTHSLVLVLFVDVSLGAIGGEEEDVVAFVGGDSARENEGMRLCIGGDEVGNPLDVIQVQDPGNVTPTTRLLLSGDDTCSLYHLMVLVILLRLTLER